MMTPTDSVALFLLVFWTVLTIFSGYRIGILVQKKRTEKYVNMLRKSIDNFDIELLHKKL